MSKNSPDPVVQLEHDHLHLKRLVESLRDATHEVLTGERESGSLREEIREFLSVAVDELCRHFDLEETELFPYLADEFPDTVSVIADLEQGHDRMCGVLARLERHVECGEEEFERQFESVIALFARFDANFMRHARQEAALLRSLGERISEPQRARLAELLHQF